MGIIAFTVDKAGQIGNLIGGVVPRRPAITTTDSLSTITTAGYLNPVVNIEAQNLLPTDIVDIIYSYNQQTNSGTYGQFTVVISNGVITLTQWVDPGNVLLPVTSGDFAVFNGTNGQIKDAGYLPSNAAKTNVVMLSAAPTSGHVASFADTSGTIQDAGFASNTVALSTVTSPDAQSDLIWYDVTASAAALATAGKVNVQVSSGSKQYKVRDVKMNYSAAGLSGGGGDRLLALTDGTTVYNNAGITAALLGTPINTVWGGTGNPVAGTVAQNTSTAAGANLYLQYSGGTTDYTTGSVVVSVLVQRVA